MGVLLSKLVRLYTFNSPIRKGKYRLALLALSLSPDLPDKVLAKTFDGRRLFVNPHISPFFYFLGEYEYAITKIISSVVLPNDICLDVGANIGWYTTLLQKRVGAEGQVHAFEPIPSVFEQLKRNVSLNVNNSNVCLNNVAVGDKEGRVVLYMFSGLSDGHTSLSTLGRGDYRTVEGQMIMLDTYLQQKKIQQVNFVKVDIEGAELQLLNGATSIFKQKVPPIWMIEMALGTTKGFGYLPNDLMVFMRQQAEYEFYVIDEVRCLLKRIEGFEPENIGANVLCVPKGHYEERLSKLKIIR